MTSPLLFLNQTFAELKKVVWPSRADLIRLTAVVILISLFVGVYIGGLDFLFTRIFEILVKAK
jgi:preprotein translocase subunit SecE